MALSFDEYGINAGFIEEQYLRYLENPQHVDESWRVFFRARGANGALPNGASSGAEAGLHAPAYAQAQVTNLVNAYRRRAHLYADINPLTDAPTERAHLALSQFGLSDADLDRTFSTGDLPAPRTAKLRDIIALLEETYCRSIGVEFLSSDDPEMRWLQTRMESSKNRIELGKERQLHILTCLTDAETMEQFLHKNFVGAKRFSLEGAESLIPLLDLLIDEAGKHGVEELVLGMAHRGRLNVLVNIMGKDPRELFAAFQDQKPEQHLGSGDVKYHLGYSNDRTTSSGHKVHLTMAVNPSHLEFVNPVVEGRARAKQDRRDDPTRKRVVPLLIHGDAAFIGQGVVAETLNMAGLDGYATGGTIHIIVNNQIGFTTEPTDSRSTSYATDIARMLKVPVFHVNGEDPEAVVQVTLLAMEYRQTFGKDVIIDMYCYRKYGHNEADEPRFTQPVMYQRIDALPTVREVYVRRLTELGKLTVEEANEIAETSRRELYAGLEESKKGDWAKLPDTGGGVWKGYKGGPDAAAPEVDTRVDRDHLLSLLARMAEVPSGFTPNPKVAHVYHERHKRGVEGRGLDWGGGEALAFASLLSEGVSVRLSGQDARRGTFTHRHAVLTDAKTGARHTPLDGLRAGGARFEVWDSPLSEAGVLGFDYGYSLDSPASLVIWEAQFGDFANGAQVIIDQFVVAAEDKWRRLSGITLLLPHGYEGQGPEHSSARLERFLQLAAEDNIQVCNLTTPAQVFHALRRQVKRPWRKPLVIMSPKSMLRLPEATSTLEELATGRFQRVIGDPSVEPKDVKKVLLCSGRVYYDLAARRAADGRKDVAILRLEQLYPLNGELDDALAPFAAGTPLVWVQDEPANMGGLQYVALALPRRLGARLPLSTVSRAESASPATGSPGAHKLEQKRLLDEAFG
ncbi:MAG: 2-oxoglutarate dehydrogenase E1 component [Polyangiaceae bacterium]|nr:2-oxoglutarate dehydrogenase E1 component [Polyangiaceae bacterium]